jgi:glycosyltransferase involved in cell wall biosynthesis
VMHPGEPGLRIVQVVETLATGGLEHMAVNLAMAHRSAGHFSSIYTVFDSGPLAETARRAGVPVVSFHKKSGFSAAAVFRIASQLRSDQASIVHTHNASIHHYGVAAARLAGARVVNTRHGLALHSSPRQDVYFRATLPATDAVVFVCDFGRRHFAARRCAPPSKSVVILNGIPLQQFQQARAAPGARGPRIHFGTIGRLVRAKAHADLLAAFAIVARAIPEAVLSIWGYGELQMDLEKQICSLGLQDRAAFHGPTGNPAMALQSLDVFVLSSISEGLPLVILEAMASGLPLVATAVGGVPEVVPAPGGAWLAQPGNPANLAVAMQEAAQSDLAAAGAIAYQHARGFSVEQMQQRYETLYRTVLAGASVNVPPLLPNPPRS